VQALAVPALSSGGDWLLASHTGSGKTLAYLLPLIQHLKEQEEQEGFARRPKRPRVLVLGPTKELTDQVGLRQDRYNASSCKPLC
jgi:superfamily II DNA/RNA helicase